MNDIMNDIDDIINGINDVSYVSCNKPDNLENLLDLSFC